MCPGLWLRIIGKIYPVQMGEFFVSLSPGKVNIFCRKNVGKTRISIPIIP